MSQANNEKPTKKIIKVRKFQNKPATSQQIEQQTNLTTQTGPTRGTSSSSKAYFANNSNEADTEEEIQVIEPGALLSDSTQHPIEFMFPNLKQEGLNTKDLIKNSSTSDLTKLLIGQKAKITRKRDSATRRAAIDFTPIPEADEAGEEGSSDESLKKTILPPRNPITVLKDSTDEANMADVSDNENEETDK